MEVWLPSLEAIDIEGKEMQRPAYSLAQIQSC